MPRVDEYKCRACKEVQRLKASILYESKAQLPCPCGALAPKVIAAPMIGRRTSRDDTARPNTNPVEDDPDLPGGILIRDSNDVTMAPIHVRGLPRAVSVVNSKDISIESITHEQ